MQRKVDYLKLHLEERMPAHMVARMAGVHENTIYNWKSVYKKGGTEALADASRAPKRQANEYGGEIKNAIRAIRQKGLEDEKRYLGKNIIARRLEKHYGIKISHSGVGKFLHNDGLIPEQRKQRRPKKERVKKCRMHEPGELMQIDVKYAVKSYANYWFFQYDAIDYITGIVLGEIYPLQSNYEAVTFLNRVVQRSPFAVAGVQTDNHSTFTNYYTGYKKSADPSHPRIHAFDLNCGMLGVTHYLIDPGKPAQNGKIERFHRTTEEEFYQHNTFKDLNALRKKFTEYLYYYNNEQEHSSFNYLTPLEKLRSFPKYGRIKEIIN